MATAIPIHFSLRRTGFKKNVDGWMENIIMTKVWNSWYWIAKPMPYFSGISVPQNTEQYFCTIITVDLYCCLSHIMVLGSTQLSIKKQLKTKACLCTIIFLNMYNAELYSGIFIMEHCSDFLKSYNSNNYLMFLNLGDFKMCGLQFSEFISQHAGWGILEIEVHKS